VTPAVQVLIPTIPSRARFLDRARRFYDFYEVHYRVECRPPGQLWNALHRLTWETAADYVMIAADDDFVIPPFLIAGASYLERNPEFVGVLGDVLQMGCNAERVEWVDRICNYPLTDPRPERTARAIEFGFSGSMLMPAAAARTWFAIIDQSGLDSDYMKELFSVALPAMMGPVQYLHSLSMIRDIRPRLERSISPAWPSCQDWQRFHKQFEFLPEKTRNRLTAARWEKFLGPDAPSLVAGWKARVFPYLPERLRLRAARPVWRELQSVRKFL
jgi:hypothetical protein